MIKNIYSFSRRSKRPPRFLQIKGLHQIKIWKFSPCFTRREDVTVSYRYTGKYPAIFDQLERTLRPSYVLKLYLYTLFDLSLPLTLHVVMILYWDPVYQPRANTIHHIIA